MQSSAADNSDELQKAHKLFLAASANRDADPEVYEGARIRYYTLKNGEGWLQQEKTRVADEQLQPAIDEYRQQFQTLQSQYSAQSGLTDSIATVRDRQSALTSSVSGSMDFLNNLLSEKQAKMSAYDRFVELVTPTAYLQKENSGEGPAAIPLVTYFASFPSSFSIILDVAIAVFVLFLLVIIISKSGASFIGFSNLARSLNFQRRGFGSPFIMSPAPSSALSTVR